MRMLRYNWLVKRGYRIFRGQDYIDPDFGSTWTVLLMSNGKKIKKAKLEARLEELVLVRNIDGVTVDAWASPAHQHILERLEKLSKELSKLQEEQK